MQADAIYKVLEYYCIAHRVKALCFDTTASNTSDNKGAAILLVKKLGHPVLFSACRHHVSEIFLTHAFSTKIETVTTGPVIPLFQRFYNHWPKIIKENFENGMSDAKVSQHFKTEIRNDIITFLKNQLEFHIKPARHDYMELLELSLLCLGVPIAAQVRKPGAVSRARWMGKAIYCIKIYLFRKQFSLTGKFFYIYISIQCFNLKLLFLCFNLFQKMN